MRIVCVVYQDDKISVRYLDLTASFHNQENNFSESLFPEGSTTNASDEDAIFHQHQGLVVTGKVKVEGRRGMEGGRGGGRGGGREGGGEGGREGGRDRCTNSLNTSLAMCEGSM